MATAIEMSPAKRSSMVALPGLAKASPTFTVDIPDKAKDNDASDAKQSGCCGGWWSRMQRWQKICFILAIIGLLILVIALLAVYVIAPAIAQDSVDNSRFVMTSIVMTNPTANSVMVKGTTMVYNAGSMDATVEAAVVTVSYLGTVFGTITLPEIQIKANKPTQVYMSSPLTVSNNNVFRTAATKLLAGSDTYWSFNGHLTVKASFGITLSMGVSLNKPVVIPGILIQQSTAFDVTIVGGETPGVLNTTVGQTFVSTSINTLSNIGLVAFNLYGYKNESDASLDNNAIPIGIVTIANFGVAQGLNNFDAVKVDLVQRDAASISAIRHLLSNYNTGKDTVLRIVGPIVCASPFFINTSNIQTVLRGAQMHTLAVAANINLQSVAGQGVFLTGYNPYTKPVLQSNMNFQVSTTAPIPAYTYRSLTTTVQCPETHAFSTLYQPIGSNFTLPAQGMATTLMGLAPAQGQSLDCFLSAPQAVMCLSAATGKIEFEVATAGTMKITFDNFNSIIDYSQPLAPTFFESLVHIVAAAQYQCAGYNFTTELEYTPVLRACPTGVNGTSQSLVSVSPAGAITDVEQEWRAARLAAIQAPQQRPDGSNTSDWQAYLNGLALDGLDASTVTLPVIGVAASGGGYRAMFNTAGVLSALDARNPAAVANGTGGILQSAAYFAGLSGGGWMVGSMYNHDFAPAEDIVASFGNFSFWEPNAHAGTVGIAEGWGDVFYRVANKKFAGYNVSLTDLWGQMLSQQMMEDDNMRLSDLASHPIIANHAAPLPILTSAQVYPGNVNGTTNVWTWSPLQSEIAGIGGGSGKAGLTASFNPNILGTAMNGGYAVSDNSCVNNMDNLGYIVGMESAAFEVSVANIVGIVCSDAAPKIVGIDAAVAGIVCTEATAFLQHKINGQAVCVGIFTSGAIGPNVPDALINFLTKYVCADFAGITNVDDLVAAIKLMLPVITFAVKSGCPLIAPQADCDALLADVMWLQDNLNTIQKVLDAVQTFLEKYGDVRPVPPATVANPFYGISEIAAADSRLAAAPQVGSIDGFFAGEMNVPFWPLLQSGRGVQYIVAIDSFPNGGALINAATFASDHGVTFPAVPMTLGEYQKNNKALLNTVTLFGCRQPSVPTVVYVPYNHVTYNGPDPEVLQLAYTEAQIQALGLNAFAGMTGFVNQPDLAQVLGCAALDAAGNTLPAGCTTVNWTKYCYKA